MKTVAKVIAGLLVVGLLGGIGYIIYKIYFPPEDTSWKVEIIKDEINVRADHDPYVGKWGKVYKGETYKVLDQYLDDPKRVWYKITMDNGQEGWIASYRNEPYVKEINNPKFPNGDATDSYIIDYQPPVLKFFTNVYSAHSIDDITYDHLSVTDESEYTITHQVYYEPKPKDTNVPQYWIQYTVTDSFGNVTQKVQKIEFEVEPNPKELPDFSTMKR